MSGPDQDYMHGIVIPKTTAEKVATLEKDGSHSVANEILANVGSFASDVEAQRYVAAAANWIMDRAHHAIKYKGNVPQTDPNKDYKPQLVPALDTLVTAGTLTKDNIHPELAKAITTYRSRYPTERYPEGVRAILDATPRPSLQDRLRAQQSTIGAVGIQM